MSMFRCLHPELLEDCVGYGHAPLSSLSEEPAAGTVLDRKPLAAAS